MDSKKIDVKLFFFRKIKTKKINVDQKRTSKKQMKNTRAEYNARAFQPTSEMRFTLIIY